MSTSTLPALQPASAPASPSNTWRTSLGKPTIEMTTSDAAATSRGEAAHLAPRSSNSAAFSFVRVKSVT